MTSSEQTSPTATVPGAANPISAKEKKETRDGMALAVGSWVLGVVLVSFGLLGKQSGLVYAGAAVCVAVAAIWKWLDDTHRLMERRDAADAKKQELDADNRRLSALVALAEACSRSSGTPEIAKRVHAIYMKHPFDAKS